MGVLPYVFALVFATLLEPPTASDDRGVASLPPPPETTDDSADTEGDPAQSEAERQARRRQDFAMQVALARAAEARHAWADAVSAYSEALLVLPGEPTALLGRAQARKAQAGEDRCSHGAIRDLMELAKEDPRGSWLPQRMLAIAWMDACGERYERRALDLLREVVSDPAGTPGRPPEAPLLLAQRLRQLLVSAELASAEAVAFDDEAFRAANAYVEEVEVSGETPSAIGLRLLADLTRERNELRRAQALYGRLIELHPRSPEAQGVSELIEETRLTLELEDLDKTQGFRPTPEAQAAYQNGMAALQRDEWEEALSELTRAIDASPWFQPAYYARGRALASMGRFAPAARDLSRAVRMDRSDYQAHLMLGLLYMKEFGGGQDAAAVRHLRVALRLRPDLPRLHLLLGSLLARADRTQAMFHYQRFIQMVPLDHPDAPRARRAVEELEREIRRDEPPVLEPPPQGSLRLLPADLQSMINEAYLRGTENEDWRSAEAILLQARERFPAEPRVLNELARVVDVQGRPGDARRYWEQSLDMREDQRDVHERLGLLLGDDLPDDAISHLRRASELGSTIAGYALAELLWRRGHPIEASRQLDAYLARASPWDLHWESAHDLRRELDLRRTQVWIAASSMAGLVLLLPIIRLWRRFRGASLRQFLESSPKSFPEVAPVLSLIRHEVLKHNTAFLEDVGRALEVDAPDADVRAEVLARRLFGDATRDLPGVHERFSGYLDDLRKVARAYRVRLNLRRKDPIFRPMIRAFDRLAERAPQMRNPSALGGSGRLRLAQCLVAQGAVLGRPAFEQLSSLLRELCITFVDARLVEAVFEGVVRERPFSDREVPGMVVEGEGRPVRVFRTDLEDILANVLRNSLASVLDDPPLGSDPGPALGVALGTEIDEITGLSSLVIRVKDRSPAPLSTEMLRGRYVERGMGITADLLSRYDGSISVEDEVGWSKAVVLRFFILDEEAA